MSNANATRTVTVLNTAGLHIRALLQIRQTVQRFPQARVELVKGDIRTEADNMLALMTLGVGQGEEVTLEASGEQAEPALDALVDLFANKFFETD
jgi:phosphotransferase system HPr (HPr) family protein